MIFGGWQKLTLIDYPQKVATTLFTVGCNLRCPFCHNSELVLPTLIKKLTPIKETEIFDYLKKNQGLIEGVCITGGEPTLFSDLDNFLARVKKLNFKIKLDTNGTQPKRLQEIIHKGLIDYLAMDIKEPLALGHIYPEPKKIEESIELVKNSGLDYEFRTTVYPGLSKEDIKAIVETIKPAKRYYLQEFSAQKILDPKLLTHKALNGEELAKIRNEIKDYFDVCEIRYKSF